jgi:AraC-like DNA-binding protein
LGRGDLFEVLSRRSAPQLLLAPSTAHVRPSQSGLPWREPIHDCRLGDFDSARDREIIEVSAQRSAVAWTTGVIVDDESRWPGRLAFGPWWLVYAGPVGPIQHHAHHAFQLVVHGGTPFVVDGQNRPLAGPVVVLEPDVPHAFRARRDHVVTVYVDPASVVGSGLRNRSVDTRRTDVAHPVSSIIGGFRPDNWSQAEEIVQRVVAVVRNDSSNLRMTWWRHPVIDAALHRLPTSSGDNAINIDLLADEVGISVERLTQLFTVEVGMPVSSYIRWMRLVLGTENLVVGASMTAAAHVAGFRDAAHFGSTFVNMFGVPPQEMVALGRWLNP